MVEYTQLKELQVKLKDQKSKIWKLLNILDMRDQEQRAHTAQVEATANACMDKLEAAIEATL